MDRKTGLVYSLVTLLAILFFSVRYIGNKGQNIDVIRKEVNLKLSADSLFIVTSDSASLRNSGLGQLSESPFGVEIYENNELIWWNEAARKIPKYKDAQSILHQTANFDAVLRTELSSYKDVGFEPVHEKKILADNQDSLLNFRGVHYRVTSLSEGTESSLIYLFCLVWMSCFWFMVQKFFFIKSRSVSIVSLILFLTISRILFSIPAIFEVFHSATLFKQVSSNVFFISAATLILDACLLWLGMNYILSPQGKSALRQIPGKYQYVLASFVLSVFFIYWNSLMKMAVASDHVFVDLSDIISFDLSNIFILVGIIFHLLAGFLIIHSLFVSAHHQKESGGRKYMPIVAGILLTLPISYFVSLDVQPILYYLFLTSVVLIFDVYAEMKEQKLTYLLWWMLLFSTYMAVGFFHYGNEKSERERKVFAERSFAATSQTDLRYINNIRQNLDTSSIFLRLGALEFPAKWDKEEIKELFAGLTGVSEENFDLELFDNNGFSLFSNHFGNYHKMKRNLQISKKVQGNNLFFHPMLNQYYLTYELSPERHQDGPWLFILTYNIRPGARVQNEKLSYALIRDGLVADKKFETDLAPSDSELVKVTRNGISGNFIYSVLENDLGFRLLVFESKPGLLKPISIFSFLFALTGIIMIILTWINTKTKILPDLLPLKLGSRASLKTKIQLSIILLIIFSFIVVGAVTAFYFYNLIQANQSGKEREETQILANSVLQESLDKESGREIISYFYKNLLDLSYIHGKSLQLYDRFGRLLATSSEYPPEFIMPYGAIEKPREWVDKGNFTKDLLHFDYIPLRDDSAENIGYLGIQHQYSDISSKSIVDFLGTILNVYIFLFLIAGVIAITIANSITKPIAILAEKLKKFTLGKSNEVLEWQSNDEIGSLIREYNNLNEELTRSVDMLAKNERDMAWREMAKQVAHEIKNPLTPMKLSIQYLEKTSKEDPSKAQDMIPRVANTLIEQIDNLSQIAVEFSNFAAMPQASNEKVVLNDLVVTIHDLFRKRDDMDITLSMPIDDLVVFADKNHLVRILNNLVKNAIQAIPDHVRGKINIALYDEKNQAIICVTDNGSGIPESMKDKVFAPNFTTKSSGTGLGLAISANMIESFNGKIYFESEEKVGTRFYIRIPLMKKDENSDAQRISLDEL
jgi:two-component system nitrogen regulation sensor histidine kinase NtrY